MKQAKSVRSIKPKINRTTATDIPVPKNAVCIAATNTQQPLRESSAIVDNSKVNLNDLTDSEPFIHTRYSLLVAGVQDFNNICLGKSSPAWTEKENLSRLVAVNSAISFKVAEKLFNSGPQNVNLNELFPDYNNN